MKRVLLFVGVLLNTTLAFSQQQINTDFATRMNNLFGQLDKNKVPNGILLDMAMEFTDVPVFNGVLTKQNYVSPKRLKEIYNTLVMGKIQPKVTGIVNSKQF